MLRFLVCGFALGILPISQIYAGREFPKSPNCERTLDPTSSPFVKELTKRANTLPWNRVSLLGLGCANV